MINVISCINIFKYHIVKACDVAISNFKIATFPTEAYIAKDIDSFGTIQAEEFLSPSKLIHFQLYKYIHLI